MLTFLDQAHMPAPYAYAAARNALRNYKWVHIRGLNGGWKSLKAQNYSCDNMPVNDAGEELVNVVEWRLDQYNKTWGPYRPTEFIAQSHIDPSPNTEVSFRDVLYVLAGMSSSRWFPEQMYRAALIITLAGNSHPWDEIEERTGLEYSDAYDIYWVYRKSRLDPYLKLTAMHQEIIQIRGRMRVTYFEEMSEELLNNGIRKMIVFPHGIYTVKYQKRYGKRSGTVEGWLMKGRKINGRSSHSKVYLGHVGQMTKEHLFDATHELDSKVAALSKEVPRKCGISESNKLMFASG